MQDNVALIAVLEAKFNNHGADAPGKRQLLCVVRNFTQFVIFIYILSGN